MSIKRLTAACLAVLLTYGTAAAQTTAPDPAATPAPRHRRAHPAPATPTPTPSTGTTAAAPAATTPAATTPAATTPVATPPAAATPRTPRTTLPVGTKINLNTATAAELDKLPEVGKARLKVIMTERAKGNYKDWDDFVTRMQHTSVNAGVRAKIKDYATF